jgi:RNA polymerase sigma-70 factor (ECF subfamily)
MLKNYKTYSDFELVELIRGKKRVSSKAFEAIFDRYSYNVNAYVRTVIGFTYDAEDIFQETFIRFYNNVKNGAEITNLQSYLIKIARNLCLNYRRDKKNNVEVEEFHRIVNEENFYANQELLDIVMRALDLMDEKYKEAFVLKKIDGLKFEEVAQVLDLTLEGAKTRVNRARIKLLEILEPYIKDLEFKE